MSPMRCATALALALGLAGCGELEKQQMTLRGEFDQNVGLFGTASKAFASAADEMAGKKHDLQRTLIQRTDEQWIKDHTDKAGRVTATAEEMRQWIGQRDAAVGQMVASREVWARVHREYTEAVEQFVGLAHQVYARELDAQKAKDDLRDVGTKAVNLLIGAGAASAIAVPLGM